MFQSLRIHNYRLWAGGALVSNVGTWMQRIGQDWLVLTVLTDHNATAVGTVMALQFGPPLLLLPLTGYAADHLDRRKLLLATQAAAGLLALGLGVLTLMGAADHVWVGSRRQEVDGSCSTFYAYAPGNSRVTIPGVSARVAWIDETGEYVQDLRIKD